MGRLIKPKLRAEENKNSSALNFIFVENQSIEKLKEVNQKLMMWLKRIGWVGFAFFLLKGLAWIAVWLGLSHYINW